MKIFDPQVSSLVTDALNEDIGGFDITTDAFVCREDPYIECEVIAKDDAVFCGSDVFSLVFKILDWNGNEIKFFVKDGSSVKKFQKVISIKAKASIVLYGERTALNFLQHLSGIATAAALAVRELSGLKTKVLDTRKTLPGLRLLQKYAVRVGGAENHRFDLSSGILIKDNHIKLAGGIKKALDMIRSYNSGFNQKIEVEVTNINEVAGALDAGAEIIMLDNMGINEMKEAVNYIHGRALVEASGNITINNMREVAETTGVDYISMGSLTNAAKPADFSLNFNRRF